MKLLVDKKYKLEKFPGKGGWTYARVPEVLKSDDNPFGWVKVMGSIDGVEIRHFHLMPMGDGTLMLSVKADIRKKIRKEAGDQVHIILYPETGALEIPGEMQLCLKDEPAAHSFFFQLSEGEQKFYVQWIYAAKKEETRASRLATAIGKLAKRLKFHDKMQ